MARPVKPAGGPDFPRRRERARATRRRVLDAARDLFIERGYVATTIDAIAERADVSPETIYATFGNKRAVLAELVDVSIAGGPNAAPILEQPWVERAAPASRTRATGCRSSRATDGGSSSDAPRSTRSSAAPRRRIPRSPRSGKGQGPALRRPARAPRASSSVTGGLRPGLDPAAAADILYAIGSPETYRHLVIDRGWSGLRFERWYADTLERLLLKR